MTEPDTFRAYLHESTDGRTLIRVQLGQEMRHASVDEALRLGTELFERAHTIAPEAAEAALDDLVASQVSEDAESDPPPDTTPAEAVEPSAPAPEAADRDPES